MFTKYHEENCSGNVDVMIFTGGGMLRAILVGTTAFVIAGTGVASAQPGPDNGRGGDPGRSRPRTEDVRAFIEARLAALKAGLALTPEQERNWPAFEQALRDVQKLRRDRLAARIDEFRNPQARTIDPSERLRQRGTAMAEAGTALQKLADAVDPLYKSLNDNQKRRFAMLNPMRTERRDGSGRAGARFRDRDDGPRGFDRFRGERPNGFDRGRRSDEDRFGRDFRGPEGDRYNRGFRAPPRYGFDRGPGGDDRFDRGFPPENYGDSRGYRGREGDRFDRGPRYGDRFDRGNRGRERDEFDRGPRGSDRYRSDRDPRGNTYRDRRDDDEEDL
jgi:hypothetical protein